MLVRFCVVAPLLQMNANGDVPLVTLNETDPLEALHVVLTWVSLSDGGVIALTVALSDTVHPFADVIVTE